MKLSRLYTNQPELFDPIEFKAGLSVVLAEIRIPANRELDTHNLGKTTVGQLVDFCLMKGKSGFFLFKHATRFAAFEFFLELALDDGTYLTIARPVHPGTKFHFKRTPSSRADLAGLVEADWDHFNIPLDKAKTLLEGWLAIDTIKPWRFRKLVGYLIRSQPDYLDVFQLGKFSGKHQDWKPFVAHLLGMEAGPVNALYGKREELNDASDHLRAVVREWGDDVDPSSLDGLLSVKRRDLVQRRRALETFDFREEDVRVTTELVDRTERAIAALNEESYQLAQLVKRIEESLSYEEIDFKPSAAEKLFNEAGLVFGEQLKKDFNQLIEFNRSISKERRDSLAAQLDETTARIVEIETELKSLNADRARSLAFLRDSDALAKYQDLTIEVTTLQSELNTLEEKREAAERVLELRRRKRQLEEEFGHLQTQVEEEITRISADDDSTFGRLRTYFSDILAKVLDQRAILAIRMNDQGGVDFTAEFVTEAGMATSGDRGNSYKKLLCIAFDLAVLRTYLDVPFPRFVYHDGALEGLDRRKREKLIGVFRDYAALGLQPVISTLDSDLPHPLGSSPETIQPGEVVATLHDEGDEGRLFKMPAW